MPDIPPTAPSPVPRAVVRAIAFLWGLQFAFLNPALALLLVDLFGASTGQVAVVLAIYNSASLLASWALPRWADRHAAYVRGMLGCALFTIALSIALSFAQALPAGVAGLVLLGAPAAVGTPLLFGYVRHSGAPPSEVVRTRAAFSTAWVAGPPLATVVIATGGGRALVLAIGAVGAANLATIAHLHRTTRGATARTAEAAGHGNVGPAPRVAVVLIVAAFAGLQATNSAAVAVTTLFATGTLHLSPVWGGVALGVAAGLEVPALLLLGRSSRRYGDLALLSLACLVGTAYYLGLSVTRDGYTLVALQVLNAAFYAVIAGVGLTLFQAIITGPGAAAGLMSNAQRAGALLSGPLIGVGSLVAGGLRAVFVVCAALTVVGLGLVRLAARRLPAPTERPVTVGPNSEQSD